MKHKKKIYLCSRVSADARALNNQVSKSLRKYYDVYTPHEQDENNPPDGQFDAAAIFEVDFDAMRKADICVVVGRFGKDCSWEIGWFAGMNRPIYFVPAGDKTYLSSPMLIPFLKNKTTPKKAGAYVYGKENRNNRNKPIRRARKRKVNASSRNVLRLEKTGT